MFTVDEKQQCNNAMQSLIIIHSNKGNLQLYQNYRTISLISHPSKVMLKVILKRFKPQAEEIIAKGHAGFKAARSTTEQTYNLKILYEKYLLHQQSLYHVVIDLKKYLTEYGMQRYGTPCGNTISMQVQFACAGPSRAVGSAPDSKARGPGFDSTYFRFSFR